MDDSYKIYHDRGLPMVFIGDTFHNRTLVELFKNTRNAVRVSLEYASEQTDQWYLTHQCMAVVTTISFKQTLQKTLEQRPIQWFSVVSKNNVINPGVKVGFNTMINNFNVIYDDAVIGDHVTITNFCSISHEVKVGDLCHISPYGYLCFSEIGTGSCIGIRSSLPGKPDSPIGIAGWTNLLMDSRVTKSISESGTYYGNKKINKHTSLDIKIL